jgi:type I restriction enzyme R subunit
MIHQSLSAFIWSVADLLRGDYKQSEYGRVTDDDKLVYVNNVINGKLLESELLVTQAKGNSKQQFANSPDLDTGLVNAIMDALAAHTTLSKQALDSAKVRAGLKDILLGPAQLYEALRERRQTTPESNRAER